MQARVRWRTEEWWEGRGLKSRWGQGGPGPGVEGAGCKAQVRGAGTTSCHTFKCINEFHGLHTALPHVHRGNKFRFANHSAKPNCKVRLGLGSGLRAKPLTQTQPRVMAEVTLYR